MKLEVTREGLIIATESQVDIAYLEDTLGLRNSGSELVLTRKESQNGPMLMSVNKKADTSPKAVVDFAREETNPAQGNGRTVPRTSSGYKPFTNISGKSSLSIPVDARYGDILRTGETGVISRYPTGGVFGFIKTSEGLDNLFFHIDNTSGPIHEHSEVVFDIAVGKDRMPMAVNVMLKSTVMKGLRASV
jgi:cold shock CspA family protein